MAEIASLVVADSVALWRDLGFAVDDGGTWVGGIRLVLGAPGRGVVGWTVEGLAPDALTELPDARLTDWPDARLTDWPDAGLTDLPVAEGVAADDAPVPPRPDPATSEEHTNGVIDLDHLVVATPDLPRTVAAFEAAGVRLRRTRDAGTAERPLHQAFFRLGPTIVEVVGSPTGSRPGPAQFYGLAFTVADLDGTAAFFGERLHPVIDAVQAGRRIATLTSAAGSTVPMAFMSPDRR